jgi:hypothetical protein
LANGKRFIELTSAKGQLPLDAGLGGKATKSKIPINDNSRD